MQVWGDKVNGTGGSGISLPLSLGWNCDKMKLGKERDKKEEGKWSPLFGVCLCLITLWFPTPVFIGNEIGTHTSLEVGRGILRPGEMSVTGC